MNNKNIKYKVSVVLCTYNGEKYIREQIDSILYQTYPIHEIIIQDDCSTDNTFSILNEYQLKYSIIHVYRNPMNKGVNPNFFNAISKATGDYIVCLDTINSSLSFSYLNKPFYHLLYNKGHFANYTKCPLSHFTI